MSKSKQNLYERLGGYKKIERIVADFYQTILNDEQLNVAYLENVSDIAALHTSVAKFFSMVFGGPAEYKGRNMYDAHKHMPLTKKDYDGVWRHMEMSYKKHGVSDEIIKEVKEVVYSFYDQIISKK